MATLILTSDGIDSAEIKQVFEKHISSKTKIAIITTAKEEKENSNGAKKIFSQFNDMSPQKIDFFDVEFQNPEHLKYYDLIHIIGGNPFRLMHFLNISKSLPIFNEIVNKDIIISGTSAGSMVLGENMGVCSYLSPEMNDVNLKNFHGLNLTKINICPHYNNFPSMYENCDIKIERFEKKFNTIITKILDGQAIIIETNNNKHTIITGDVVY